VVDCLADDTLMQTRPDQQQLGAAEVRILTENLYKLKVFGGKKLISQFFIKVGMS